MQLFVLDGGGVSIAEIQENGEEVPLPEMEGADGAEREAGRGEIYNEKDTEGELSAEEEGVEDKPDPYTTGILYIVVFVVVAVVIILMILVKRRK